jgi:hypothetical protein
VLLHQPSFCAKRKSKQIQKQTPIHNHTDVCRLSHPTGTSHNNWTIQWGAIHNERTNPLVRHTFRMSQMFAAISHPIHQHDNVHLTWCITFIAMTTDTHSMFCNLDFPIHYQDPKECLYEKSIHNLSNSLFHTQLAQLCNKKLSYCFH